MSEPSSDIARHQRLREILLDAAAVEGAERERRLAEACGEDEALRQEAEELLAGVGISTHDLLPPTPAEAPPDYTTIGPYRIEERLGAGAMGTVYAARAPGTGKRVALKVLHPHLVATETRRRFLREAEVGARVTHRNVVRTLDSGTDRIGGREVDYLVMEHVEGRTLGALLDAWGTIPEALLREIASQAADGLAAIHAEGIVHRDLKPENLMLTNDHRLRIMDLGIAREALAETRLTATGHFVGSLLYAAPEQLEGGEIGAPADLYALGLVLYELAAGANPFHRSSAGAVLRTRLAAAPPPIAQALTGFSPFFSAVIEALMQREPGARFVSAAALRKVLEAGEAGAWWRERQAPSKPELVERHDTRFHGRENELVRLDEAWARALGGEAMIVQVFGEAGLGKTRLFSEFVTRRKGQDLEVLVSSAAGGLRSALARRMAQPGGEAVLQEALAEHTHWLPVFSAWLRREIPPRTSAPLDEATRVALVVRVLERLTRERPLVLVVDDLEHSQADEVRFLIGVLRAARRMALLALVGASSRIEDLASQFARLGHVERIDLARLDTEASIALIVDVVGEGEARAAEAAHVAELGGGIPLFVLQLARVVAAGGDLDDVPESLGEQVRQRLKQLDRDDAEILDLAAVAGLVFDADPIARVREWSRLRILSALGRLERVHGLVRSEGARFRFDHPLVREVIYQGLPPALRGEIHRLLADALVPDWDGDPDSLDPEALLDVVHHRLRSSDPACAKPLVERAVERLRDTARVHAMRDLLERALVLPDLDPALHMRWQLSLGSHLRHLGDPVAARAAIEQAIREADDMGAREIRIDARLHLGSVLLGISRHDEALALFREARDLVDESVAPRYEGQVQGWIGQAEWLSGRYDEAERCQREVIRFATEQNHTGLLSRGLANLSVLMHETGRVAEAAPLAERAIEIQRKSGDLRNEASTCSNLGNVYFDSGRLLDAKTRYEDSLSRARALAWRAGEAVALLNLAHVHQRLGETARAESTFKSALSICRFAGLRREEGYVLNGLGGLEIARGDGGSATRHLEAAAAIREELDDQRGLADTKHHLGMAAELERDAERAVGHLDDAYALAVEVNAADTEALSVVRRAAITGEGGDEAAARYDELEEKLRYVQRLECGFLLWRATGDRARLEAAKAMLEEERAHLPEAHRASFVDGVRLHAAIMSA